MKTSLCILCSIGLGWLFVLVFPNKEEPHILIRALLPNTVIAKTSQTEHEEILKRFEYENNPGWLSWAGALSVISLSVYALRRVKTIQSTYVYSGQDESDGSDVFNPFREPQYRSNIRYQRYDENQEAVKERAEINKLLEKISNSGIDSLTQKERSKLDEYAKRKKT